ncbi:MAG: hypothetical protein ACRC6U_09235 [Fusobacteriaceae bacterium]
MQDLFIDSQGGFNFEIKEDNEVLRSQIVVFLSIRASDGYDDGELDYDINQGLDYDLLLDGAVNDEIKLSYVKNQIKRYYQDVEEIKNIKISKEKSLRETEISFEFKSIYEDNYIKVGA